MRLLYLTHNVTWKGGGIFFTAYHQGRHLVQRGHEVVLLSISPDARRGFHEQMSNGVRIIETPDLLWGKGRSGWDPADLLRRIGFLRRMDFDLIHGFESRPVVAGPGLYLRGTHRVPLVLTWADWFGRGGKGTERGRGISLVMGPIENWCEEYFYPRADWVIAMGDPLVERAVEVGVRKERILNLLHGCDPKGIVPMTVQEARTQLGGLPLDAQVIGYLGVLRPSSAELLFAAFSIIRRQAAGPCKLVMIGNHKLNLDDFIPADCRADVIETGWLSYEDVNLYLSASDILALPLKRAVATDNVWPSKFNDYLAAGRATVATSMRVLESLFQSHQVGLLTDDDPSAFADGCLRLMADAPQRLQMGKNARALAEGELSWESTVDRLEQFYIRVLDASS